jgi:hypothetical protein
MNMVAIGTVVLTSRRRRTTAGMPRKTERGASGHRSHSALIQSRLKDIGYAKEVLGGIVLTKDGLQRISEGK